ncbi:MAG TPA: hypothetical protein VIP77_05630 [Jiangellaceae bacterium]
MRDPALPAVVRPVRLTNAGPSVLVQLGWLALIAMFCLMFAAPLVAMVTWDLGDGYRLTDALWRPEHRALTIAATGCCLLLLTRIVVFVIRLPRATTRREVVADATGLESIEYPRWWYRGRRARIDWDNVQAISAQTRGFTAGRSRSRAPGNVLEIYLFHDVAGLPSFAVTEPASEANTDIDGIRVPASRVCLGGPGDQYAAEVRDIAEIIGALRPELFYAGAQVDQWYVPPLDAASSTPAGSAEPAGPQVVSSAPGDRPADTAPGSPVLPRPGAPLWLDYGHSPLQLAAAVVGQVALMAGCLFLMNNPFGWSTVPAGLVAFLAIVPFLFCCLTLPASLWLTPRFIAGVGVLVTTDGLEFVRKRPWRLRATVRTTVTWDWMQAIVARHAFHVANTTARRGRAVDIYLYENRHEPTVIPGVGVDVAVTQHVVPDSAGTAHLVTFPATRLRLTYRHDVERRGRELWTGLVNGRQSLGTLPAHQLRPALFAFRPDLCHGFDDLWEGVGGR